jgi:hypothetical protein
MVWYNDFLNKESNTLEITPLREEDYKQILENEKETEKHYCSIDHAIRAISRQMQGMTASLPDKEEPQPIASASAEDAISCTIEDEDIPS